MTEPVSPAVLNHIVSGDALARHLGIVHEELRAGYARASMQLTEKVLNFHGTTHGGALCALAAATLGAAANSHGQVTVATGINMEFLAPSRPPTLLLAEAREVSSDGGSIVLEVLVHAIDTGDLVARGSARMRRRGETFGTAPQS